MMKEPKSKRFTFRMTEKEAATLENAARMMNCKPAHLARIAVSAVAEATREKMAA